ncbi:hypothetical protein EPICR_60082 [Candidatus Desulfarcum epimagneticum]|uniref:Uncharacterized protein n=1 Tax=uncultured Desulfobacteraceae bacterium TaxID=218296 RepID=A0A484HKZ7_9BACT|nr:hypothetical protein EPICR_60082 [uncultured Desulfobacteraceae bacterium]
MTASGVAGKRAFSVIGAIFALAAGMAAAVYVYKFGPPWDRTVPGPEKNAAQIAPDRLLKWGEVIDYDRLGRDPDLQKRMEDRKARLGLKKSLDIIAGPGEKIKIGEFQVDMDELSEKVRLKDGGIVETDVRTGKRAFEEPDIFGIYIVSPGDNLWNVHFRFLKDYFSGKGIALSPLSDEPDRRGRSSAVGKILKFAENMTLIYNLKQKEFSQDIHLIEPKTKIVIYRISALFPVLDQINDGSEVHFDGESLWVKKRLKDEANTNRMLKK